MCDGSLDLVITLALLSLCSLVGAVWFGVSIWKELRQ